MNKEREKGERVKGKEKDELASSFSPSPISSSLIPHPSSLRSSLVLPRRRFYAPFAALSSDNLTIKLDVDEARHLRDVLRLGRGDEVFVFDGEGREYRCRVENAGRRGDATLERISEVEPARPESTLRLNLALALLKNDKFDLVVQKATELGVANISPVVTKLADVRVRDAADAERRRLRWRRIAIEAAKQSGRARVPTIDVPREFASLIERPFQEGEEWRLMFSEREGRGLVETINRDAGRPATVTALVGSEGGWTDEEIAQALSAGWRVITLGGRILRAETAAIAVTALLQHLLGDLR